MARRRAMADRIDAVPVATLEASRARWRSARTARAWTQSLEKHAFPKNGTLPVERVGQYEMLRILEPLSSTRPQLARKLRQRIRTTLK